MNFPNWRHILIKFTLQEFAKKRKISGFKVESLAEIAILYSILQIHILL